jgi:hypothetical protein
VALTPDIIELQHPRERVHDRYISNRANNSDYLSGALFAAVTAYNILFPHARATLRWSMSAPTPHLYRFIPCPGLVTNASCSDEDEVPTARDTSQEFSVSHQPIPWGTQRSACNATWRDPMEVCFLTLNSCF